MIIRFVLALALMLSIAGCNTSNTGTRATASEDAPAEVKTLDMGETVMSRLEQVDRSALPGAALYTQHCQHCHNGTVSRAPQLLWLMMMSPQKIFKALNTGLMKSQAAALSTQQHRQLAEYISRRKLADTTEQMAYAPQCSATTKLIPTATPPKTGWGHDTARFIPADVAGLAEDDVPKLQLKWAYAFPDATRARSQPAVGYGAVYVGSEDGSVYALDIETGCSHWRFEANAEVRTGIVLAAATADRPPLAVFGDVIANMYAVNALTGELVWRLRTDEHPSATLTATPAVTENMVYASISSLEVVAAANPNYECCSFRGNVIAVDLATGELGWRHYIIPEQPEVVATTRIGTKVLAPSGAPSWTSPAIDRKRGMISGHDPDDGGRLLWQTRAGRGSIQGGVHFGMAAEGTTVYAPINDINHSNDGTMLDDSAARPGVSAINAADGEVLWRHVQQNVCDLKYCDPGISAAVTAIPGVLFAGHLDGFVRAYANTTPSKQ